MDIRRLVEDNRPAVDTLQVVDNRHRLDSPAAVDSRAVAGSRVAVADSPVDRHSIAGLGLQGGGGKRGID